MAITTNNFTWGQTGAWDNASTNAYWDGNSTVNASVTPTEHHIQGQMLTATITRSTVDLEDSLRPADLKMELCKLLAQELFKANCIEFTQQHDVQFDTKTFRARIYAVPNTQVKVLREYNK